MPHDSRRARDLKLLDDVDAYPRRAYSGVLWRVVPSGRDPLQGGRSASRWCNGEFDVLYTSFERDGAIAEVHALLSLQPVFPSKLAFNAHRLNVSIYRGLDLADLTVLGELGVETARYQEREYAKTQDIADAAFFLGFDGLLVPSARWSCSNAVLFTERIEPANLAIEVSERKAVDWRSWRKRNK